MDKRVKTIKTNCFKINPHDFLRGNKTGIEKYRYVLDHFIMLGLEPTFDEGEDETHILVTFECEGVHCTHSYLAKKRTIQFKGNMMQGTTDRTIETVDIKLVR